MWGGGGVERDRVLQKTGSGRRAGTTLSAIVGKSTDEQQRSFVVHRSRRIAANETEE